LDLKKPNSFAQVNGTLSILKDPSLPPSNPHSENRL